MPSSLKAKGSRDKRMHVHDSNKGNSTKAWLMLMLVGCVLFGYVANYHDTKLFFNTIDYYKDAAYFSNAPQPAQQQHKLLLNQQQPPLQLSELTRSHIQNIICPEPLLPVYDRIISSSSSSRSNTYDENSSNKNQQQLITKSIHFAWIRGYHFPNDELGLSRCLAQDMIDIVDTWKEQFPSYNFYFHDDVAVDALFYDTGNYWYNTFPQLKEIMNSCVKFGSAMRIDIWRILILYRYGGFYADFDVAPGPKLTELTVHQNVSAFFLSDAWNRPSQWLIGIEPNHPIMYHTMLIIIEQLVHLADVSQVRLVFVTGPDSLKKGYTTVISTGDDGKEPYKQIFNTGIHRLRPPYPNKMVHKLDDSYTKTPDSISSRDTATKTTRKERVNKDMNTTHWKVHLAENRRNVQSGRCIDHLYKNSQDKTGSIE